MQKKEIPKFIDKRYHKEVYDNYWDRYKYGNVQKEIENHQDQVNEEIKAKGYALFVDKKKRLWEVRPNNVFFPFTIGPKDHDKLPLLDVDDQILWKSLVTVKNGNWKKQVDELEQKGLELADTPLEERISMWM